MSETRKLATILFADIAGYTALMQRDEQQALQHLNRFKEVLEKETNEHQGQIVQYFGDGCLLSFESSTNAVNCAIALQHGFSTEQEVPVRIGIHLGEVLYKGDNVYGDGVNVASRIESLGIPGSILMSRSVRNQVKNKSEFLLASLGSFDFKNVDEPVEVFALANPGFVVPKREEMQGKLKTPTISWKRKWLIPVSILLFLAVLVLLTKDVFYTEFSAPSDEIQSIAVLPLVNMSADPDQEYFADGLTEELLNLLAKIQNLQVTSRTSAFTYKDKDLNVPEIAKELGVNHVLEGSVRKSGDQIRITVQLIQAAEDVHLWSDTYDRKLDNIFAVQDEIAAKVVDVLEVKLLGDVTPKAMSADPQAYTRFLEARHQSDLSTMEALERAETLINQSISIDSTFAPAWKQLSEIYVYQTNGGARPTKEGYALARKAAERSLALDSTYALAHSILGIVSFYEWDFEQFNKHLTKALELDPGNSEIVLWSGIQESIAGDPYKAVQLIEKAVQLDPVTYRPRGILMQGYYYVGRCEDAIRTAQEALRISPTSQGSRAIIGLCHLQQGQLNEAEDIVDEISLDWLSYTAQSMMAFAKGDTARSDEQLNQLITHYGAIAGYQIAQIYAFRDNHERTFEWFEKAYEARDPGLTHMRTDPIFKNVHDDPRWKAFLVKMGFNPEPWER